MYDHLNIVYDHLHIPEEAFLFLPARAQDVKTPDDFRTGYGKNISRMLYEGWAVETYTPFERQKLKELEQYIKEKRIAVDPRWDDSWRLRFYLSSGWNPKKCVSDMEVFIKYQYSVRDLSFNKNVAKHLKEGVFYITGRDCHYRPILVFDVEKIIKANMTEDELIETQTYFFEYIIKNYLIPGQVENWIAIVDVAQTGLISLISSMKRSFTFLSETYRMRMLVCYVVRIPTSISLIWTLVKQFLDEDTVRKINFFDDQTVEPLLEYCNPSQLERKFGGALEDIAEGRFWPPREVSINYKCSSEPVKLLTKQEYTQHYKNKTLYKTKFHEENLVFEGSNQLRDNINFHAIKRIEKDFKIELEMVEEDKLVYESDILPFSELKPSLHFLDLFAKHTSSTTNTVHK